MTLSHYVNYQDLNVPYGLPPGHNEQMTGKSTNSSKAGVLSNRSCDRLTGVVKVFGIFQTRLIQND